MAKYFYVATEELVDLDMVYPVASILSITHVDNEDSEHYTRIETPKGSITVIGGILKTLETLDSDQNVVWFQPMPISDNVGDFIYSIG